MPANPVCIGIVRTVGCLCILTILVFGHALAQPQAPAKGNDDPKTWPYSTRSLARGFGNVGRWWSLLNENERAAFLDGFQVGMREANQHESIVCQVLHQQVNADTEMPLKATVMAVNVCSTVSDTAGYDKVTVKDLDDFYSDPVNQPIVTEWSMGYLRDKATGRKTEGQLLDTLRAEQKDVHDCSKYPHLCTLGAKESGSSQ